MQSHPLAPLELKGQQFVALNGGPGFPFPDAVSLVVSRRRRSITP
jgi:predicted 3-demethylubiquinone-9 3-methyltransferase (glyoxalase superfamily)